MSDIEDVKKLFEDLEGIKKTEEEPQVAEVEEEPELEPELEVETETETETETEAEPVVEEPAVVVEPKPLSDLETENEKLRQALNEMARRVRDVPALKHEEPVAPKPGEKVVEILEELTAYITDEEADNLIDKPKEVLMAVANRVAKATREAIMKDLPPLVGSLAQHQISMLEQVRQFYKTNPELDSYRDFCSLVATQIEQEHPDWGVMDIYTETAKIAKVRLGLKVKMEQKESALQATEVPTAPALPGGARTSRKPTSSRQLSDEQKSMVAMMNLE